MTWVKSLVRGKNAALLAEVARLYIGEDDVVVDLTYGKGNFWKTYQHPGHMSTNDIDPTTDAQYHFDFKATGWIEEVFDVVVFDPPYITPGGRKTSTIPNFNKAFGLVDAPKDWAGLQASVFGGALEAHRLLVKNGLLFFKCMDFVMSGKTHWHGQLVASAMGAGFTIQDVFVHDSGTGPQPLTNPDGSVRIQRHARKAHSYLYVLKKQT